MALKRAKVETEMNGRCSSPEEGALMVVEMERYMQIKEILRRTNKQDIIID